MLESHRDAVGFKYKALSLIDGCSEGRKREASDLEVLLCEGDTNDGNAKNNANDELEHCEEQTAENEPERVAEGMLLKVGLNSLTEGEEGETCHLKALDKLNGVNIYNLGTGNGYSVLQLVKAFEAKVAESCNLIRCPS